MHGQAFQEKYFLPRDHIMELDRVNSQLDPDK